MGLSRRLTKLLKLIANSPWVYHKVYEIKITEGEITLKKVINPQSCFIGNQEENGNGIGIIDLNGVASFIYLIEWNVINESMVIE